MLLTQPRCIDATILVGPSTTGIKKANLLADMNPVSTCMLHGTGRYYHCGCYISRWNESTTRPRPYIARTYVFEAVVKRRRANSNHCVERDSWLRERCFVDFLLVKLVRLYCEHHGHTLQARVRTFLVFLTLFVAETTVGGVGEYYLEMIECCS